MKKYNFGAGPCILPREVIEKTASAILDFNGIGLSIAEISHRSKAFQLLGKEGRLPKYRCLGKESNERS